MKPSTLSANGRASRSLAKVAAKLGKSSILIERWSTRDGWQKRVHAWDRYESKIINQRVLIGTAAMRERQALLAMPMAARVQQRVLSMTTEEIDEMTPVELVALIRVASEIEWKAREIREDELGSTMVQPEFRTTFLTPGSPEGMVRACVDGHGAGLDRTAYRSFRPGIRRAQT